MGENSNYQHGKRTEREEMGISGGEGRGMQYPSWLPREREREGRGGQRQRARRIRQFQKNCMPIRRLLGYSNSFDAAGGKTRPFSIG